MGKKYEIINNELKEIKENNSPPMGCLESIRFLAILISIALNLLSGVLFLIILLLCLCVYYYLKLRGVKYVKLKGRENVWMECSGIAFFTSAFISLIYYYFFFKVDDLGPLIGYGLIGLVCYVIWFIGLNRIK